MKVCPMCVAGGTAVVGLAAFFVLGGLGGVPAGQMARAVAASTMAAPAAFNVDPVHSSVVFKIKHMGVSNFYGRFDKVSGSFNLDFAKPETSALAVVVDAASVNTNNSKRDDHLKSQDFFSAKEFAQISFTGKEFKKTGEHTMDVTGELSLHGQKKTITLPVEHTGSGKGMQGEARSGVGATFTIKRSDFGMSFMLNGVGDEVTLMVGLEGAQ